MRNGLFASASYLYGRSDTVHDGTNSTAFSNWRFLYTRGNPNIPILGISDRDIRHRVNAMASYRVPPGLVVAGGTWDELDTYIEGDDSMKEYRGVIPERNTGRGPWTNLLDFRLAFDVPVKGRNNFHVTLDVSNFLNMLNQDWGVVRSRRSGTTASTRRQGR